MTGVNQVRFVLTGGFVALPVSSNVTPPSTLSNTVVDNTPNGAELEISGDPTLTTDAEVGIPTSGGGVIWSAANSPADNFTFLTAGQTAPPCNTLQNCSQGTNPNANGSATATSTTTSGSITATGNGLGAITAGRYASNPVGTPTFTTGGTFFDVPSTELIHLGHHRRLRSRRLDIGAVVGPERERWHRSVEPGVEPGALHGPARLRHPHHKQHHIAHPHPDVGDGVRREVATKLSSTTATKATAPATVSSNASDSATVTGTPGGPAPSGTVTFYICYNATTSPTGCNATTDNPSGSNTVNLSTGTSGTSGHLGHVSHRYGLLSQLPDLLGRRLLLLCQLFR